MNTWFYSLDIVSFHTFYLWHPPSNLDPKTSIFLWPLIAQFTVSFLHLLYFLTYKPPRLLSCFQLCESSFSRCQLYSQKKKAKCFFSTKILQKSISFLCLLLRSKAPRRVICSIVGLDSEDCPNLHQTSQSLISDM